MKKIAFLLDFDGPLFDNDKVKHIIINELSYPSDKWNHIYNQAKRGASYVDYGYIISHIARELNIREKDMWKYLLKEFKSPKYSSDEDRSALVELASIGKIELITQGHSIFQRVKIKGSHINEVLKQASKEHSVAVIEADKSQYLKERLTALILEGYEVIQIDDRIGPLYKVNQYAAENNLSNHLYQIRIRKGKYDIENVPKTELIEGSKIWNDLPSLFAATHFIKENLSPHISREGGPYSTSATMRR